MCIEIKRKFLPALSSFINQATAAEELVEHSPAEVSGNASPSDVVVAHPLDTAQLSTSLPGKHSPSDVKPKLVVVAVFWKSVDAPDTRSAGSAASWSRDGGELEVDSDSHGLLTSPDNLRKMIK